MYAGYRWKNFQFSTKVGLFAPVAYSSNGAINTSFSTDSSTGTAQVTASLSTPLVSAFNFEETSSLTIDRIIEAMNGCNIDVGAIYMKEDKAIAGVHLNNIPIKPATAHNQLDVSLSMTQIISSPVTGDTEPEESEEPEEPFSMTNTPATEEISMPLEVGAFYSMTYLPVIDIIVKGELVFADTFMYSLGLIVEADLQPFPGLSLGIGYNRVMWEAFFGLHTDIHLIEMGLDIGMTSPEIGSLFNAKGLSAKLFLAIGI
jgi:hypothetical protein